MEVILLCGIYLVELACYQVGIRILFDVNIKTYKMAIGGILIPILIALLPVDPLWKNVFISDCAIGIILISIKGRFSDRGVRLLLTFLFLECIDKIFILICKNILIFNVEYSENINFFKVRCCIMISVFILYGIKKKINQCKKIHINSAIYFVLGTSAISMMFCLAILNQIINYLPHYNYVILCEILNIAIFVSIFLLVAFVVYIKNTHEKMEQLLKTEQMLKESQVNYYKQILKKEEETRKYRHDMVNHLIYVQDMLNTNKVDHARRYLIGILGGFEKIQKMYYSIGNEMVDIIMNYFFGMLPQDVHIELKGRCPVNIDMNDTDICTVFSNLFQNSVEEIIENNIGNAKIYFEVYKGKYFVQYVIKNSVHAKINEKYVNKNGLPISHKADIKNHGIGMLNTKNTVEKYNGKFEWTQEKDYFCVSVVLPLKQ